MATRPFTADNADNDVRSLERAEAGLGSVSRHQLNVIAASMADVLRFAGGWLCDRARAGWDVNVLVAGCQDVRPLTILGAAPLAVDAGSVLGHAPRDGALAVSAELLRIDARVREDVLKLLKRGTIEVTVWGQAWPAELGRRIEPTEHRLSVAARAFKAHALVAAAVSQNSVSPIETLFPLGAESVRPLYSV